MTSLAEPLHLRSGLVLRNRIAKAAMTEALAEHGDPGPVLHRLYAAWSEGGAGLLVTGNAMVDRRFLERSGNVVLDARSDRAALSRWALSARSGGAATLVQISHPGRQVARFIAGEPVAPSAVPAVKVLRAFARPRALRESEIGEIVERFGAAAAMAKDAGFDGVQVHGAHGYLVSQFLSPRTNQRSDGWGGSLANRARFLLEVVKVVRERCGAAFTLAVKLNSADFQRGGFSEDESLEVVSMLDRAGIDLLEISGGNYESTALLGYDERGQRTRDREAYFLEFAKSARKRCGIPLMLTGGIRSRAVMDDALGSGAVDVVGLARPFCVEPDLPKALLLRGAARVPSPHIPSLGLGGSVDALAETAWCDEQMGRIGRGLSPDPSISVGLTTVVHFLRDVSRGVARRAI